MADSGAPSAVSAELRELLAKKADIAAKLNLAVAEVAKHKAELSKTSAELLRKDQAGALPIRSVARW